MRTVVYILIMFITFYIGGVYRDETIIVLFCVEAVFFVFLLLSVCVMKWGFDCKFKENRIYSVKGSEGRDTLIFINRGFLPVFKFYFKYKNYHIKDSESKGKRISGCINKKSETVYKLNVTGEYCGILYIKVYGLKICDHMNIFKLKKRMTVENEVFLLPDKKKIKFLCEKKYGYENKEYGEKGGSESGEIRQLKLYEDGENVKNIHWSMYARTDELYSKEFEDEKESNVLIHINLNDINIFDLKNTDRFYELSSALMFGVLESFGSSNVLWFDNKKIVSVKLKNENDVKDILTQIYNIREISEKYEKNILSKHKNVIEINFGGELLVNGRVVYKYSAENYIDEINKNEIVI